MKNFVQCLIALTLLCNFSSFAQGTQSYTFDPLHTFVGWHTDHFGFSHPSGKWFAQGKLEFDKNNIENSKVNVTIKISDMVTGIEKLDNHLKSETFFDVEKFPTATFVSDKIESSDNKTAQVHGILTVHGISVPITLDMSLNKVGVSPVTNKETVGFTGKTTLKRSDFDINAYLPGLSDEVKIEIEAEANKDN